MLRISFFFLLLLSAAAAFAQPSKAALEAERNRLNQQLKQSNQKLGSVQKTKKQTSSELKKTQQNLNARVQALQLIQQSVETLHSAIEQKDAVLQSLQIDVAARTVAYQQTARLIYRYKRVLPDFLAAFLPQTSSLYLRQGHYLAFLSRQHQEQLYWLTHTQKALAERLKKLQTEYQQRTNELQTGQKIKTELSQKAKTQQQIVQQLSSQEQQLRKQIAAAQKSKQQLSSQIASVIRQEMNNTKSAARSYPTAPNPANPNSPSPANNNYNDTQAGKSFAASRGRLPQPVRGTIIGEFGRKQHADLQMVFVDNNGIDIKTAANAPVSAVFEGLVVSVFTIPSMGNAVMLKHGEFYTIYAGLSQPQVKRGQNTKAGQLLGYVGKNGDSGSFVMHFELWRGKQKENPALWLR